MLNRSLENSGNSVKQSQGVFFFFLVNPCRLIKRSRQNLHTCPQFCLICPAFCRLNFWGSQGSQGKVPVEQMFYRDGQRFGVWQFQCSYFQNVLCSVQSQGGVVINKPEERRHKRNQSAPSFKPLLYSLCHVWAKVMWLTQGSWDSNFLVHMLKEHTAFLGCLSSHYHWKSITAPLSCKGQSQGDFARVAWPQTNRNYY